MVYFDVDGLANESGADYLVTGNRHAVMFHFCNAVISITRR